MHQIKNENKKSEKSGEYYGSNARHHGHSGGVGTAYAVSKPIIGNAGSAGARVKSRRRWLAAAIVLAFSLTALVSVPLRAVAAAEEWLDVSFGGTFTPQHGYTSGGDEQLGGGSLGLLAIGAFLALSGSLLSRSSSRPC